MNSPAIGQAHSEHTMKRKHRTLTLRRVDEPGRGWADMFFFGGTLILSHIGLTCSICRNWKALFKFKVYRDFN